MIEWVTIPAGEYVIGSDDAVHVLSESPAHLVFVAAFQIARTPITNVQYHEFVRATGRNAPASRRGGEIPEGQDDHPVNYVTWFDATVFAEWYGARLPTEAEWEAAARGRAGNLFPWGNAPADATRAHFAQDTKNGGTASVFEHSLGANAVGVLDMAGNVWEWVSSLYAPYPYDANDGREDMGAEGMRGVLGERVLRGGSFYSGSAKFISATTRSSSFPSRRRDHIGFRIARSIQE